MTIAYLIHARADQPFVDEVLLPALPVLGFDRVRLAGPGTTGQTLPAAMEECGVILAVVSEAASGSPWFRQEALAALQPRTPVLPLWRVPPDTATLDGGFAELRKVVGIDASGSSAGQVWRRMSDLLPSFVEGEPVAALTALPLPWHEEAFSTLLRAAVKRHDYNRCVELVGAFERHPGTTSTAEIANGDLDALRRRRQFLLMRRYAEVAIADGLENFRVRRQLAQALIELKDLDRAIAVLQPLIAETMAAKHAEQFEARGLLGRAYKQQYVNAGGGVIAGPLLLKAISTYRAAFTDSNDGWPGINTASCILRANHDLIPGAPSVEEALEIAGRIRDAVGAAEEKAAEAKKTLSVWDLATRVEAYVDLGDFRRAGESLDVYLAHPDADAFEVASTYRQFDEVLQLTSSRASSALVERLRAAARQRRGGSLISGAADDITCLLISVSDPAWTPDPATDIEIRARIGTTVSVRCPASAVETLLKDPSVITVERSGPAGSFECDRSVPFVGVALTYLGSAGDQFTEDGAEALVAIVDDGIDVLHEAFLGANGRTRIVGIWDQRDASGPPPPVPDCDFGTYHGRADIDRYVAQRTVPEKLRRPNRGHGTHVASIAAGRGCGKGKFAGGVAPGAEILVVISRADQPTGYSDAHVAALAFIEQIATSSGKPVVVNLSQGMNAGPHNGLSRVEAMFDNFTIDGIKPGRVVVKSAGNEQDKRAHAKLTVPNEAADELVWECEPGAPRQVLVELWWSPSNEYRFTLASPRDEQSASVGAGKDHVHGTFAKSRPYQLSFVRYTDEGLSKLNVVFDTGITPVKTAEWTLTIEAVKVVKDDGLIHAWIERDDANPNTRFRNRISEEMTLSVPGTAKSVISVGAIATGRPLKVSGFSSFGPTLDNREKPDISAPGVGVRAALRDSVDRVIAMDGTSMAAPHVTGAIALLLSRAVRTNVPVPSANIAREMLTSNATAGGRWDRGRGSGVLNVTGLLAAL